MEILIQGNLPKSRTDKGSSVKLQLPSHPEEIEVSIAQKFATYDIIGKGPVQVPTGEELTKVSWSGVLFGEGRSNAPWMQKWILPETIINYFKVWKEYNVKLKLTISMKDIDMYVYLENCDYKAVGGFGDYEYSISFIQAKDISVSVTKKTTKSSNAKSSTAKRTSKAKAKTYTVKSGDCLWNIAKKYYKNGSQWKKIYNANKNTIENAAKKHGKKSSNNGNLIYPGTKLTIP